MPFEHQKRQFASGVAEFGRQQPGHWHAGVNKGDRRAAAHLAQQGAKPLFSLLDGDVTQRFTPEIRSILAILPWDEKKLRKTRLMGGARVR